MEGRDMKKVITASFLCILLCLSLGLTSAQLFPTPFPPPTAMPTLPPTAMPTLPPTAMPTLPPTATPTPPVTIPALPAPSITDEIPPLVILKELHPKYFVMGDDEKYKVEALVIDNVGVKSASFLYRINEGAWKETDTRFEEIPLPEIKSIFGVELPEAKIPRPGLYTSEIPSQTSGSFIEFKVRAEDVNGNAVESPIGMYFVTDDESETKIMVIDPSFKLWLCKENALHFKKQVEQCTKYEIPAGVWQKYEKIADVAEKYDKYVIQRHWWEMISEDYNIIIVDHEEMEDTLKSFAPDVIIISNVWIAPWDLSNHGMSSLQNYARERHAGIIVTHGTLSDWILWTGDKRDEATEVCTRGQVGDKLDVYLNPRKETIAMTTGLYPMPLMEYIRDQIAEQLCEQAKKETNSYSRAALEASGRSIGSTPLAVPYVPFSGKMLVEEEHPVLNGLPKEFEVSIPSAYNELGADAYTLVGWQYVFPTNATKVARERAKIAKDKAEPFLENVSQYLSETTGYSIDSEHLIEALDGNITTTIAEAEISPELKATVYLDGNKHEVQLNREVVEEMINRLPVKVVALSDDCLAGILVCDEWFRPDGHRSVYFSFEPEASQSEETEKLIKNAIEWTKEYKFTPPKEIERLKPENVSISNFKELAEKHPEITPPPPAPSPSPSPTTPGFEAIYAVVTLALFYFFRHRKLKA